MSTEADPPLPSHPATDPSSKRVAPVAAAVADARREAEATRRDVDRISKAHLQALLADGTIPLTEHVDDPELTDPDRARLLATIQARQGPANPTGSRSKRAERRWRHPSFKAMSRSTIALALAAFVIGVPLRNTTERAIITKGFETQFRAAGRHVSQIKQPGQIVFARRWLRWTPVAVEWAEDARTYITAPLPRSAIRFPEFPYFDSAYWQNR